MLHDLLHKMNDKQLTPHVDTVLFQQKYDKDKIYSLYEPHVEFIAKGKAHKRYKFGNKASITRTKDSRIILGALWVIPYDGHTIDAVLKQLQSITGVLNLIS
jgi:transposase, IS5 family